MQKQIPFERQALRHRSGEYSDSITEGNQTNIEIERIRQVIKWKVNKLRTMYPVLVYVFLHA